MFGREDELQSEIDKLIQEHEIDLENLQAAHEEAAAALHERIEELEEKLTEAKDSMETVVSDLNFVLRRL